MTDAPSPPARNWIRVLAEYRDPSTARSLFELAVTAGPLMVLWAAALFLVGSWPFLSTILSLIAGLFMVRLFIIQHDCGHGSFLGSRKAMDWVGRILGVFTATPYAVWKHTHGVHHSAAGHLEKRGMGDVMTLTVDEYRSRGVIEKIGYRLYRHPLVMFGIGPAWLFLCHNRLPMGLFRSGPRWWVSAMGTNLSMALLLAAFAGIGGVSAIFLIWLPTILVAASIGVWLFYVQHQFEETYWEHKEAWDIHEAALHGSSHYVMPVPLRWITGNIGIHHVHHLYSRIPFYRLTDVLRDHPELANAQKLTIAQSISCARRHLWDTSGKRLLTFREARALV